MLLSASRDGTVKVWDPLETDPSGGLPNQLKAVWFSPDARQLITVPHAGAGELILWNTMTRQKIGPSCPRWTAGAMPSERFQTTANWPPWAPETR